MCVCVYIRHMCTVYIKMHSNYILHIILYEYITHNAKSLNFMCA